MAARAFLTAMPLVQQEVLSVTPGPVNLRVWLMREEVIPNKSQQIAAAQRHIEIIHTASLSGNSTTLARNPVAPEKPEMDKITPAVFDAITTPESSQKSVNRNTIKDNMQFSQQQQQKSIVLVKHISGQPITRTAIFSASEK